MFDAEAKDDASATPPLRGAVRCAVGLYLAGSRGRKS